MIISASSSGVGLADTHPAPPSIIRAGSLSLSPRLGVFDGKPHSFRYVDSNAAPDE